MLNVAAPEFLPASVRKPGHDHVPNHLPQPSSRVFMQPESLSNQLDTDMQLHKAYSANGPSFNLPPRRYGHAMNTSSVHLTGLSTFLGKSFRNRYTPSFGQFQLFTEPNLDSFSCKEISGFRPLKANSHNLSPSVCMSSTASDASVGKAKRKAILCMPIEGPLLEDDKRCEHFLRDAVSNEPALTVEQLKERFAHMLCNYDPALIRGRWVRRKPCPVCPLQCCDPLPANAMISRPAYPDTASTAYTLPDTIDIYLPGNRAWDELCDLRSQSAQSSDTDSEENVTAISPAPVPRLNPFAAPFQSHTKSWSVSNSTPPINFSRPRAVLDKQTDDPHSHLQGMPDIESLNSKQPYGLELPARLRDAFVQRKQVGPKLKPTPAHSHTMSLSLPNSGRAFGPDVYSALDLIRASADNNFRQASPTSSTKLLLAQDSQPQSFFLSNITEVCAEGTEDSPEIQNDLRWKLLGKGFGIPEQDLASTHLIKSVLHTDSPFEQLVNAANGNLLLEKDDQQVVPSPEANDADEIRTNPSEDADTSDFEEDFDHVTLHNWQYYRRSCAASSGATEEQDSDEGSPRAYQFEAGSYGTGSERDFSNPSDEELARFHRTSQRQGQSAVYYPRAPGEANGRPRADTDSTLPSSSIGEGELYESVRQALHDVGEANASTVSQHNRRQTSQTSDGFRFPLVTPTTHENATDSLTNRFKLNAAAKEFRFRDPDLTKQAALSTAKEHDEKSEELHHFRLPSITISDPEADERSLRTNSAFRLNVAAPEFTPAAFTFTAPEGMRLSLPDSTSSIRKAQEPSQQDKPTESLQHQRDTQGREKRQRHGPSVSPTAASEAEASSLPSQWSWDAGFDIAVEENDIAPESAPMPSGLVTSSKAVPIRPPEQSRLDIGPGKVNCTSKTDPTSEAVHKPNKGAVETEHQAVSRRNDVDKTEIEKLASRVDQALQGWAGRILDEVTIMGQVRPPATSGLMGDLDTEAIVEEIARRVVDLVHRDASKGTANHSRTSSVDTSDDTESTIRASRRRKITSFDSNDEHESRNSILLNIAAAFDAKLQEHQTRLEQMLAKELASVTHQLSRAELRAEKVEASHTELLARFKSNSDEIETLRTRNEQLQAALQIQEHERAMHDLQQSQSLAEAVARAERAEASSAAALADAHERTDQLFDGCSELGARVFIGALDKMTSIESQIQALQRDLAVHCTIRDSAEQLKIQDANVDKSNAIRDYCFTAECKREVAIDADGWWRWKEV